MKIYIRLYINRNSFDKININLIINLIKCLSKEFYRLFFDSDQYIEFIKDFSNELKRFNDIFSLIEKFIGFITNIIDVKVIIFMDNYDKAFVKIPISNTYISQLKSKLNNKEIKIIIYGSSEFFNELKNFQSKFIPETKNSQN